jgi:glycosyltransferase involved in cell wall biosynthesis
METAGETDLRVGLDTDLPASLPVGMATAIFCCGTCFHPDRRVERLEIAVDGARHEVTAFRMPRLDLFSELHPTLSVEESRALDRDSASSEDPAIRCYRSGFWATLPIEPLGRPGEIELRAVARLAGGVTAEARLGTVAVTEPEDSSSREGLPAGERHDRIAVCMATFDPDIELFRVQIDSLRAQTDASWVCLISDDCSQPDRFESIQETVAGDPRFVVSRSEKRIGFYMNFERALRMVPADVELVALCDQDDRWYPDKLETLREAIGGAQLVYSDQRLVDRDGRVLRETLWRGRRNNHTNFASLLIANTVVGASSLFRRRVIEYAVPFPHGPGWQFHDHWLAMVAMALGELAYVDRPLYDYVQHQGAILGQVAADPEAPRRSEGRGRPRSRVWLRRGLFDRWRAAYFFSYMQIELQAQVLLGRCSATLAARKRRALRLLVAAGRSPIALAWLATRPGRALFGRNETLQTEEQLVRGILWRHLVGVRALGQERPRGSAYDTSLPPFDPASFGLTRMRRWLAGH